MSCIVNSHPLVAEWRGPSNTSQDVTDTFDHVQGIDFLCESIVVIRISEVQFSDGVNPVALLLQAMAPTRDASIVRKRIVPVTDLVDIAASGQGGTSRDTDGTVRVCAREPGASASQSINVGCFDHGMSIATGHVSRVLV